MASENAQSFRIAQRQFPYDCSLEGLGEHYLAGSLTILFTTESATLRIFKVAVQLARQLRLRIQILVTLAVPYPLPLHKPQVNVPFRLRHFLRVCEQESVEARVDVRLCRDVHQSVVNSLLPNSLVLLHQGRSWWPFTSEKRLARSLESAGHQVMFFKP